MIEPEGDPAGGATLDAHGMDPAKVLSFARALGARPVRTWIVACEPGFVPPAESDDVVMELTPPVEAAVSEAVKMVEELIGRVTCEHRAGERVMG